MTPEPLAQRSREAVDADASARPRGSERQRNTRPEPASVGTPDSNTVCPPKRV